MAPKKRGGRARATVVTARKVVEETVSVVVTPVAGETETESQTLTEENQSFEILTPPPSEEPTPKRTINVEDKSEGKKAPRRKPDPAQQVDEDETQPADEPEEMPSPPKKESGQKKTQKRKPEPAQRGDEDETQPAEEPEEMPTPPKMEADQKKAQKRKPDPAQKAKGGGERKRKRAKVGGGVGPSEGYRRYVFRVMKQVHPDMGISSKAMTVLNNLMGDMFERIANEAAILTKYVGRTTLASVDIQDAVKLVLPGELGKHAIAEGTKAVANYVTSVEKSKSKP
ncbi:histone H2B.1-like [Solanum pennellii]|uniref:Histone H2B.1-like n=1 Tax=Solanum pennellii TaxID=28526 RepID=A0ABM1GZ80_SOLPN|nr:histone H2B.1-like [Solanum pennellii]